MKQIQGKQGLVRDMERFGNPRVREIGIPPVYREPARKHPGKNVIPVNPELYSLIKGHASSCKCLRVQINEKRMSLVQPYFEYCWLNKTAMIFVTFNLSDLFLISHLSHSIAWLLNKDQTGLIV